MQPYADKVLRSHGIAMCIRVGMNSGEGVVRTLGNDLHMDDAAVGSTTHLAARTAQTAAPGNITLTGVSERVEYREITDPLPPAAYDAHGQFYKDLKSIQQTPIRQFTLESCEAYVSFRPERVVTEIAPRPILFVHGKQKPPCGGFLLFSGREWVSMLGCLRKSCASSPDLWLQLILPPEMACAALRHVLHVACMNPRDWGEWRCSVQAVVSRTR